MAAYSLEGQQTQRASRKKRLALLLGRYMRKPLSGNPHMRKATEMQTETNPFELMMDTLRSSVIQISKTDEDKRDELLGKSLGEFAEAWGAATDGVISQVAEDAFSDGAQTGLGALVKGEDAVEDSMTILGAVIAQAEDAVVEIGEALGKSEAFSALAQWVEAGKVIANAYGRSLDAQLAKGEVSDEEIASAEAEIKHELMKAEAALVERVNALAKEEGVDMDDEEEVGPIETIGRLAAAILVQIDQMQGGDEGDEGEEDDAAPREDEEEDEDNYGKSEKAAELSKSGAEAASAEAASAEAASKDTSESAALAKAMEKIAELEKSQNNLRKELKKASVPQPKGSLRAVDKTDDGSLVKFGDREIDVKAEAERLDKMSPDARALELIKMSQKIPTSAF